MSSCDSRGSQGAEAGFRKEQFKRSEREPGGKREGAWVSTDGEPSSDWTAPKTL